VNSAETAFVRFGADGLVPVVVQDALNGDVLMLAMMNAEALRLTRETGRAHYWSRSRGRLWRKGETSGNEQLVLDILINCEQNSLLLRVRQIGAVCHQGFPTCFYRRVEEDGSLTVVRAREFDPGDVYGDEAGGGDEATLQDTSSLAESTRRQFAAYAYLRDHDLTEISATSRLLRDPDVDVSSRVRDELRELAGVLTGEHQHSEQRGDLVLEASQVIYWLLLLALRRDLTWAQLRPDRALAGGEGALSRSAISGLLRADAESWSSAPLTDVAARAHETLALVGHACSAGGVDPRDVIDFDLAALRARDYLAPHFSGDGR
jgi:phosphoribosyl-AMP cyclohydrolase